MTKQEQVNKRLKQLNNNEIIVNTKYYCFMIETISGYEICELEKNDGFWIYNN